MNTRHKIGVRVVVMVVAAALLGVVGGVILERQTISTVGSRLGVNDKLSFTMNLIENKYVDNIARDSLLELVVPALINKLDPHSSYIPAAELTEKNEPLQGKFDGIGVMFNMLTDTVLVTNVISGGPSDKAGVVAGDRIITVNDSVIAGRKIPSDEVVKKLKGTRGTKVTIGVQRNGSNELARITITRGVIPMKSLDAAFVIADTVGYIKFSRFAATTYKELMEAMAVLTKDGAKRFVVDLRGNGGGYMEPAILIANEFLEKGQKIVYTEGAHSRRLDQYADGSGKYKSVPLVVMIDEGSASASEILAGAIQDNDRGLVVGRRSFGKGLVQEQIDYPDGSALLMTIAHYYTPVGRSIQKPYKMGESDEYFMELYQRAAHDELFSVDSIKQNEKLKFVTPKGRVVYGGGGIMPDEFVPLDTAGVNGYFRKVFAKNLIFRYATKVVEENRPAINKIDSFAALERFLASKNLFYDFVNYASKSGVQPDRAADAEEVKSLIMGQIKGYIGRNTLLEDNALYFYFHPVDKTAVRAVELLRKE